MFIFTVGQVVEIVIKYGAGNIYSRRLYGVVKDMKVNASVNEYYVSYSTALEIKNEWFPEGSLIAFVQPT